MKRANEMEVVSHYNIRRVVNVYAAVQDRDLGAVGRDVQKLSMPTGCRCCRAAAS